MTREKKTICVLIGMIIGIVIAVAVSSHRAAAKTVKEYLGEWYVSTYTAGSNTPSGSRATSSGARATEGWTCAVDMSNPLVPMGSMIEIEGFGVRKVQDYGGFGRYNGGMRAIDVFVSPGEGGLFFRKLWLIREETKTEKQKRLAKLRKKRQKEIFTLAPCDAPVGTIAADPDVLKIGSTVQIGYRYYEVEETRKGLGNVILIGGLSSVRVNARIEQVFEEAVG